MKAFSLHLKENFYYFFFVVIYRAHLIDLALNVNYSIIIIPINFWSYDFLFSFLQ